MTAQKEAIILIHGLGVKQKDFNRDLLLQGLLEVPEGTTVTQQSAVTVQGADGLQLQVTNAADGTTRMLDIYEAFWADLVTPLSQGDLKRRVWAGLELLVFWVFSGVWKGITKRKALTGSMLVGLILLLAWYWSTVAMFFTAVGQDPSIIPSGTGMQVPDATAAAASGLLKPVALWMGRAGTWMGGWKAWLIVSLVIGFLPVNTLVDIADFTHSYLTNVRAGSGPVGVRNKIRSRVSATVRAVVEHGGYSRVTVLAHSFGTALAVDLLADFKSQAKTPLRLVTLGGPLELMARRSSWMAEEISLCAKQPNLEQWIDFSSNKDWFCTPTPFNPDGNRLVHRTITQDASLRERLLGETHYRYLASTEVLSLLLAPPPSPSATGGAPAEQPTGS